MKKLFLMATTLLIFGAVNAQIGDVKVDGYNAKIYDDKGNYSYNSISLCSNCELSGFNSNYVVITDGSSAKIYDSKGNYTYNSIGLCSNCSVKNVTPSGILIKDGNTTKIYDFKGNYTYKSY